MNYPSKHTDYVRERRRQERGYSLDQPMNMMEVSIVGIGAIVAAGLFLTEMIER